MTEGARAVDEFAVDLGRMSWADMVRLEKLAELAPWREVAGRLYETADVSFWEPCRRSFFIRMPAGGEIPRHHDRFIQGTTHHLVLETNEGCVNGWIDTQGRERGVHLARGHRYRVAREPLHWAYNRGQTPRVHLLVEFDR